MCCLISYNDWWKMHAQYSFGTELHILPCSHKISWKKRGVGPFWMSPATCDTPAIHHEITRSTQIWLARQNICCLYCFDSANEQFVGPIVTGLYRTNNRVSITKPFNYRWLIKIMTMSMPQTVPSVAHIIIIGLDKSLLPLRRWYNIGNKICGSFQDFGRDFYWNE